MSAPIRVAMIIQGYLPRVGGAERQLAALAPLLQTRGVELHVLTRRYAGLAPFEMLGGVPVKVTWSRVRYRGYGLIAVDVTPKTGSVPAQMKVRALTETGALVDEFTIRRS